MATTTRDGGASSSSTTSTLRALVPGGAHGAVTVLLGHPLDTAKTRMQALHAHTSASLLRTIARMYREDGVHSFYRGATPPLLVYATKRSVQFAAWEQLQRRLTGGSNNNNNNNSGNDAHKTTKTTTTSSANVEVSVPHASPSPSSSSSAWRVVRRCVANPFVAGALAGAAGTLLGCPMHVIKIQTQCQTNTTTTATTANTSVMHATAATGTLRAAQTPTRAYNAWTCMLHIARVDGVGGFYRGFRYHLVKDACFAASYLGWYSVFLRTRRAQAVDDDGGSSTVATPPPPPPHMTRVFCAGVGASMLTWLLLYPLDTLKTLAQSRHGDALAGVCATRPRVLYRGMAASLLRAGPVSGIAMLVYESLKP